MSVTLRTFAFVDSMQPQYAALTAKIINGDPPVAGQSELLVEMSPGSAVYAAVDAAVKSADVRPSSQVVEREYGMFEIHGEQEAVGAAAQAVLMHLDVSEESRIAPQIVTSQIVSNVDPFQAQLINKASKGALLVPGMSLLLAECQPASYVVVAANEAEKGATVELVHYRGVGRFGRLLLAGSQSEVVTAEQAARTAIESVSGQDA